VLPIGRSSTRAMQPVAKDAAREDGSVVIDIEGPDHAAIAEVSDARSATQDVGMFVSQGGHGGGWR